MNRKGYDEQTWFTFSYSPIRDDDGRVAGMFCACYETTRRVLAERALRELNDTLERRVSEALAERKVLADIVEGHERVRAGGRPRVPVAGRSTGRRPTSSSASSATARR